MREINKWMCKGGKTTHLLLDGGTLTVGESFYNDYIGDILHGERLCVVEKKTNPFRFFVDVDFVSDEHELDFIKVSLVISKVLYDLGPCVLARARPRPVEGGQKYGLHVIWPESVVTKQKANSLRLKILSELGSDWEKIIDASVYAGSGLRMLWSLKNELDSTPYIPWGEIRDGTFTEFQDKSPTVEYLKLFSIRIEGGVVAPPPTPSSSHHETSELESYIQTNIPGHASARIVKVNKCKNKKDYWIGTTSRYCDHVKREHKSNHVWFCLRPSGMIAQKCQDEECKGYTGRFYRIPSRLIPNEGSVASNNHCVINDYLPDGWKKG